MPHSCVASCYPDEIASAQWVSMEDLCVIILDEGVVDNHMPNNVMDSLVILSNNLGMKPHCGELVETIALKKIFKLDSEGSDNVCACTEVNGNGTTTNEENGHTETRIDSIILEEKEVSINLEADENGELEEVNGEQIVVSVDVNV